MNQLPVNLTLYYPTYQQFGNYLGFCAILSIALFMWTLASPAILGMKPKKIAKYSLAFAGVKAAWPVAVLVFIVGSDLAEKRLSLESWGWFCVTVIQPAVFYASALIGLLG